MRLLLEELAMNRNGENGGVPDRNSRFYQQDDYWYYTTREGVHIGPFDTLQKAESGVSAYIDFVLHAEPHVLEVLSRYRSAA